MLIENSRMSEAGASKTPSGGYKLYMYLKSLQIDALLYGCSVMSRVERKLNGGKV